MTYGLSVFIYSLNSGDKVPTISFQEYGILSPVIVLVIFNHCLSYLVIVGAFWVEHSAEMESAGKHPETARTSPAAHYVAISTEDFGKTANYYICKRENMHIQEIPNCFVYDHSEVEAVCERSYSAKIGGFEERVTGEFAKERKKSFAVFATLLQIIKIGR